jgi:histidinol-phosphate/aromatic aminotransferase/cobyric acid decarboxylase-like protein
MGALIEKGGATFEGLKLLLCENYYTEPYSAPLRQLIAERLRAQRILVKPLGDRRLGPGFMRVTTAQPEDNRRFVRTLRALC